MVFKKRVIAPKNLIENAMKRAEDQGENTIYAQGFIFIGNMASFEVSKTKDGKYHLHVEDCECEILFDQDFDSIEEIKHAFLTVSPFSYPIFHPENLRWTVFWN